LFGLWQGQVFGGKACVLKDIAGWTAYWVDVPPVTAKKIIISG